jgi:hypothetical protein
MRNRIENASLIVFFGLTTFMMIKLLMFIIGFFHTIGIDTTALAAIR